MTFAEHPDELAQLQGRPVARRLGGRGGAALQGAVAVPGPLLRAPTATFHGETIPAGFPVLIVTGAANRDPRAYDDPDRFDIERTGPARHHLRARHPLLHRRPPGPPRGQDRLHRALPPLARPRGRPRRHPVRPHGQRRRPVVGARRRLTPGRELAPIRLTRRLASAVVGVGELPVGVLDVVGALLLRARSPHWLRGWLTKSPPYTWIAPVSLRPGLARCGSRRRRARSCRRRGGACRPTRRGCGRRGSGRRKNALSSMPA